METNDITYILSGFMECGAWADAPRDEDGDEIECDESGETWLYYGRSVCKQFAEACADDIATLISQGVDFTQIGHDLWLTGNHHGAGFWDRGYEQGLSDRLTAEAHLLGPFDCYAEDGMLEVTNG